MSELNFLHSGGNKVTLTTPDSLAANKTFKLPNADGSSGQFLKTDGSGALSFGGNSNSLQVLEQFCSLADGSTHTLSQGSVTMQNVTGGQEQSTTWTDINGSVVNYKPPTGTTKVIYDITFFTRKITNTTGILFYCMSVDDTANVNALMQSKMGVEDHNIHYRSVLHIGASYTGGASVGQYTSWGNSTKKLSVKARDYSNSYNTQMHETSNTPNANWLTDGFASGTGGSGANYMTKPIIQITSLGSV
tara:strand:- start:110 stop:850 length:741 start_codon:yes stop_codon:yes gene_type:complete